MSWTNLKNIGFITLSMASLSACGDGGDGFKSLKGSSPATLSESEQGAAKQAMFASTKGMKNVNNETNTNAYSYNSLKFSSNSFASMVFNANENQTRAISATATDACPTSGSIAAKVDGEAKLASTDTSANASINVSIDMNADQCKDGDDLINGNLKATASVDMHFQQSGNSYTGNAKFIMAFNGELTGTETNGTEVKNHSISFKDFAMKIEADSAMLEKIDSMSQEDQVKELLKCRGSIILDGREITCDQFILATINQLTPESLANDNL